MIDAITILQGIYLMGPAYFANMAPVVAKRLRILPKMSMPVDLDMKMDGKPIFGKHKTYRGVIVGIAIAIIIAFIQKIIYPVMKPLSLTDYSGFLLMGFLLGTGAIFGDIVKSFAKRRLNIKPGKKFIPFDQVDFALGAYIFILPFYSSIITIELFAGSLVATFFLHIIVNHAAFYLGIRREKW